MKILSISFRDDELKRIAELMTEYDMNRHQIIKLAVRRFLFPHEKSVPLDDKKLTCNLGQDNEKRPPQEANYIDTILGKAKSENNKTSSIPPFLKKKISFSNQFENKR